MDSSTITTGVVGVGILGAIWNKLQIYWDRLWSLFFVNVYLDGPASYAVQKFLVFNCKCLNLSTINIKSRDEYVRPLSRNQIVGFRLIPIEPTIWLYHRLPFLCCCKGPYDMGLTFLRGTVNAETFLFKIISEHNTEKDSQRKDDVSRFGVVRLSGTLGSGRHERDENPKAQEAPTVGMATPGGNSDKDVTFPLGWQRHELGCSLKSNTIELLSLPVHILEAIDEAMLWRKSENWFTDHNVPWKRGWLLYGKPGTGKTAFTRALGRKLNCPIYTFDLATMSNEDFIRCWGRARSNTPCIALFEDIDSVFNGRENVAVSNMIQGLSFDCLLNSLDGAENTDGMFVIITTNDITKVDPALGNPVNGGGMSSRPGRIDRTIEFPLLDNEGKMKMALRILGDFDPSTWRHIFSQAEADTGAQFQERCCRLALSLFWKGTTGRGVNHG